MSGLFKRKNGPQDEMESGLLLDVVIRQGASYMSARFTDQEESIG